MRYAGDITSIVLVNSERHWVKSQAVLHIAKGLNAPFPVLQAILQPIPWFVRDTVYEYVANNRYKLFGESDSCRMMLPEWRDRFLI
jgi:predicted DCC family thiol-disulfide oxidoreductase YuxK